MILLLQRCKKRYCSQVKALYMRGGDALFTLCFLKMKALCSVAAKRGAHRRRGAVHGAKLYRASCTLVTQGDTVV